eukprot:363747-Chlamydomonas_euryale.AAC.18
MCSEQFNMHPPIKQHSGSAAQREHNSARSSATLYHPRPASQDVSMGRNAAPAVSLRAGRTSRALQSQSRRQGYQSGPTKGMPVLSAARQRRSSSVLCAVTSPAARR